MKPSQIANECAKQICVQLTGGQLELGHEVRGEDGFGEFTQELFDEARHHARLVLLQLHRKTFIVGVSQRLHLGLDAGNAVDSFARQSELLDVVDALAKHRRKCDSITALVASDRHRQWNAKNWSLID